ncbi:uncharacterized protein BCR38DRAFT_442752 [Pseudomassariella vexata]|uniref:Uncharacterized protein n=1 Tax=Pseudomassariella vexata TaxID=1141098 RepID=A0A1Y2DNT9_9PEZI|nr:uncharacterized protein BCR38DRAFT_442752 [Pseudomassariella vexata]ORY60877.1 hypothetical protein BCR38DRAFT_442752 [Pseudomassariella vexata]
MPSELAPRFQLVATLRSILVFFGIFALLNGHTYIGTMFNFWQVRAAFIVSWVAVVWNIICVAVVTLHPHMQRLAGQLPFPVSVNVRGRKILSYGDADSNDDDGVWAPLTGSVVGAVLDVVLATLVLVFMILARDKTVECRSCLEGYYHVERWMLNIWWMVVIAEYGLALIQIFVALGLWYKHRSLNKRGQISLA